MGETWSALLGVSLVKTIVLNCDQNTLFLPTTQVLLLHSSDCCVCGGFLVPLWEEQWSEEVKD